MGKRSGGELTKENEEQQQTEEEEKEEGMENSSKRANAEELPQRRIVKACRAQGGSSAKADVVPNPFTGVKLGKPLEDDGATESPAAAEQQKGEADTGAEKEKGGQKGETKGEGGGEKKGEEGSEKKDEEGNGVEKKASFGFGAVSASGGFAGFGGFSKLNGAALKTMQPSGFGASINAKAAGDTKEGAPPNPFASAATSSNPFLSFSQSGNLAAWGGASQDADAESNDVAVLTEEASQAKPAVTGLMDPADVVTGEEGEKCVYQVRAKLFKLATIAAEGDKANQEWIEVGIGPLKVLLSKQAGAGNGDEGEVKWEGGGARPGLPARVVMRREAHPGAQGTKILMNVALRGTVRIAKQAEKAVRITCVTQEDSKSVPVTYLLKVKLVEDADQLLQSISTQLENEGQKGKEEA